MERTRAFLRARAVTPDRQVDAYLTENLPRLARDFELAIAGDLAPFDDRIAKQRAMADGLEGWKAELRERLERAAQRVTRLEIRAAAGGMKG